MQIRKTMSQKAQRDLFTGIVEMDETYVGGKPRKAKHNDDDDDDDDDKPKRGRGTKKTPVIGVVELIGVVERDGNVAAKATDKTKLKGRNLRTFVKETINTSTATLMTDEYKGYRGMERLLPHKVIKHQQWYVDGDIHTNTIEGFWSLLKRGMFGQFHSVSRKHLQRYIDEFCYRYNGRHTDLDTLFAQTIQKGLAI